MLEDTFNELTPDFVSVIEVGGKKITWRTTPTLRILPMRSKLEGWESTHTVIFVWFINIGWSKSSAGEVLACTAPSQLKHITKKV
jgi:hypothetical protein